MSRELPVTIPEELAKKAVRFGYLGVFSHRKTLQDAYNAAMDIINNMDEKAAACTAMMLVMNTNALGKAQQVDVVDELREMARATKAYIEDGSRSQRRADALLEGARTALEHAEEQFGPEEL